MPHATLSLAEKETDLRCLDDMIAALVRSRQADLLMEHLHSARTYLLGAMPEDYLTSLESAKSALKQVPNSHLRRVLGDALANLLAEMSRHGEPEATEPRHHAHSRNHKPAPMGVASILWKFFDVSDTSLGIFYPKRVIVASFPSLDTAKRTEGILRDGGFAPDEVVAVPGVQMLQFFEELRLRAGFLAVYGPWEIESARIRELVAPLGPISMRRYGNGSIETLV